MLFLKKSSDGGYGKELLMRKSNWSVKVNGQGTPVNQIMNRLWMSRGIEDPASFLHPRGYIYPSTALKNIVPSGELFVKHIRNHSKFLIYGDVDVDGCSAAAELCHYLCNFDVEFEVYINGKKDHGVKDEFFNREADEDIVIVVDSINDTMREYDMILGAGKDLIVLDHHIPSEEILAHQEEIHLVSSANDYPNPHLSGSGVTWKFLNYVDELMGTTYSASLMDLAAAGIIADVCSVGPESMENREICDQGMAYINNVGIRTIIGADEMNSESISFSVAPLVNAANRMNENRLALDLFLVDNTADAKKIVKQLGKIKEEQKALVTELFAGIEEHAIPQLENKCLYFTIDESFGTLGGLIATKASDKWSRPVIIVRETPYGYAGSMRATGVDNFSKIVNDSGLGECAGHENSAGIVIPAENFDALKAYIESALTDLVVSEQQDIDLYIERMQITPFLIGKIREFNRIAGAGFPSLKVLIENVGKYTVKPMSQGKHLCIEVPDMKFLYWNFNKWDDVAEEGILSAVGSLDESFFAGRRTIQMIMQDYIFEALPTKASLW